MITIRFVGTDQKEGKFCEAKFPFRKISLTSLMGHMPAGAFGAGWLARCLRQSEFDVSQILTVLGGGCP